MPLFSRSQDDVTKKNQIHLTSYYLHLTFLVITDISFLFYYVYIKIHEFSFNKE